MKTNKVHFNSCKCGADPFWVTPSELADALGVIECEGCGKLLQPSFTAYALPAPAYYDTFAGMVKCVVLEVKRDTNKIFRLQSSISFDSSTSVHLKIKITATSNHCYKSGQIIDTDGIDVFPRKAYHKTGIFTYRVDPYKWETE